MKLRRVPEHVMSGTQDVIDVLHVDDDPEVADLTAEFLTQADERLAVHTATHPDDGFDILTHREIDCVVSDYDMPGWTGIGFLEAVRERHPDLPFILYTGKGSEEVASEAISAGVTDYLQKGTGTEQYEILANRIRNAVSARRAMTDATRRRHRLEQMLKTVPSCVVQLDHEGRFVFANDRAVEVLGLSESALTDRTFSDPEWRITDLDGDPIPEAELPFRRVRDTGDPLYDFRHTIEWPDGTQKTLSVNGAPLTGTDGSVESVVFSISDITDRVRRERERRRYRRLVDAMREAVCIYDEAGRYVAVNQRLAAVRDTTPEAIVGEQSEFLATIRARADGDPFRELLDGDRDEFRGELDSEFDTLGRATVEYRLTPLVVDDAIEGVVGIVRDITERKRREEELRQARAEYEQLIDGMNDAAWVVGADGSFLQVNDAAVERTGYPRSDLLAMRIDDIDPTVEEADAARLDTDSYDDGMRVFETVHETRSGERFPVEVSSSIVSYRGETARLSIAREITERKRRERRMDEFVSMISHDLRNPLNVARGRVKLAQDDRQSDHLDRAERAHARMEELIDDLLALAREGATATDPEPVDLDGFVRGCWRNVATGDATLRVECDRTILADRSRFRRLVENLLSNAIEHGGSGVTVTLGGLGDETGVYIADDGPGIAAGRREEVFEVGHTTRPDGTGFGLQIVTRIAEDHGWELRLTDGVGGGACFEITGIDFVD
jgi:PAS domain S-box-containing protein